MLLRPKRYHEALGQLVHQPHADARRVALVDRRFGSPDDGTPRPVGEHQRPHVARIVDAAQALIQLLRLNIRLLTAATVVDPRVVGQVYLHWGATLHTVRAGRLPDMIVNLQSRATIESPQVETVMLTRASWPHTGSHHSRTRPKESRVQPLCAEWTSGWTHSSSIPELCSTIFQECREAGSSGRAEKSLKL